MTDHPMSSVLAVGGLAGNMLLVAIITLGIYRVFFHPLRSYPGPLLAKVSNARNGYHAVQQDLHLVAARDHLEYGQVVRHGPNKLLFNSARALHDIYDNDRVVKSHVYSVTVQSPGVFTSFNVVDPHAHRQKRKIISQVFSDRSMRIFEPVIASQVDTFVNLLYASCKDGREVPVNMAVRLEYLSCDIVSLLAFGYPLKLQTDETYRFMCRGMTIANYYTNTRMQFFRLHQLRLSPALHFFTNAMRERYKKLVEKMIGFRMSEDRDVRHDLYSIVSKANDEAINPGDGIRMGEIWSEGVTFFPAGAFSTSTTMSALFFYLSRYPKCHQRLSHEIRDAFETAADIRFGPKLTSCKYLRACIDETMRMSPPIPGTMWRELQPGDDSPFVVDGHVIPPGTQVGVNTYSLHHNEEYFPDAHTFNPDRWLAPKAPESERNAMRAAFAPFSIGYRDCAGKNMAYLKMSLIMAKTLWYFDFNSPGGEMGAIGGGLAGQKHGRERVKEYQLHDIFSAGHDGPYLVFQPRGDVCKGLTVEGLDFQ
ncbi:cytochrome P450 [Xylariaceae sp. FL0804]|nr:cytochrome P450 [Xylariaceae sp. FL0804]